MKFQIERIHEKGRRENNEDSLLSHEPGNFFMVCDGVGGSHKGEVASQLAADSFMTFLSDKDSVSKQDLKNALMYTEQEFDKYSKKYPESEGMATTLTFLQFQNDKAIAAHCGDSRIYHIRDGKILFQSKDHSFVQELVDSGYITPEQALTHPKRNQITQAIQGSFKPAKLDVHLLEDIKDKDLFMLCSDGILEGISNEFIEENFKHDADLNKLRGKIVKTCEEKSNDNYTAIIISLKKEDAPIGVKEESKSAKTLIEKKEVRIETESRKKSKIGLLIPLILLLAGGAYFYFNSGISNKVFNGNNIEYKENNVVEDVTELSSDKVEKTGSGKETDEQREVSNDKEAHSQKNDDSVDSGWRRDFNKKLQVINNPNLPKSDKIKKLKELKEEIKNKPDNNKELKLINKSLEKLEENDKPEEETNENGRKSQIDDSDKPGGDKENKEENVDDN